MNIILTSTMRLKDIMVPKCISPLTLKYHTRFPAFSKHDLFSWKYHNRITHTTQGFSVSGSIELIAKGSEKTKTGMVGRYSQKSDKHLNSKVLGEVSSKIGSDAAKCLQESGWKNQINANIGYQQCLLNIFICLFIVYTMPQQNGVRCCEVCRTVAGRTK